MLTNIVILMVLIALSSFFSASEVAFISLTNAKVDAMVKRKLPQATMVQKLKSNSRRLLITILIGNNIVNIASASLATVVAGEMFDSAVIGITTGVMTLIVLVFGEIIPKSYAHNHAKKFAIFSAPIFRFLQTIGYPFILIFEGFTNLVAGKEEADKVSEEEIRAMTLQGAKQGAIEKDERVMIERLFQFNDITAKDIMTPRVNIEYLENTMTIEEAANTIKDNAHTRYPVIDETPDNIIGYVHARDVLLAFIQDREKKSIKNITNPILRIPQQMRIDDVLHEFQKKNTHITIVMDEFGGTEGIATLEDVLEELVGEIADEHDVEDNVIKRIDKNTIIASGDEQIRDINDFFNVQIPGEPLDTIAETVLNTLQKSPRKGMRAEIGNVTCSLEEVKKNVITKVRIAK